MRTRTAISAAVGVWVAGMLVAFHPVLLSGLDRTPADPIDPRLVNAILEHEWLWLTGDAAHASFWSPPVFYPATNTAAYSETLLGVAPLYWLWRAVGALPDTSYQLWLLTLTSLNYAAALALLRRGLGLSWLAALAGAFLFAFGSPRLQQINHPQMLASFWIVLALAALLPLVRSEGEVSARARWLGGLTFGSALAAQLWAGFYVGWFAVLATALGLVAAMSWHEGRRTLARLVRSSWAPLSAGAGVAALLVAPLLTHSLAAASEVGLRPLEQVTPMLPRPLSWISCGTESWTWGWLATALDAPGLPMEHEHRLGIGLASLGLSIGGLVAWRRHPAARVAGVVLVLLVLLTTMFPGDVSAWPALRSVTPGAGAIRAVSRVGVVALVPLAFGAALGVESLWRGRRRALVAIAVAACVIEQGAARASWDKHEIREDVAALASRVPTDCEAFLYTPSQGDEIFIKYHVDAMWAAIATGKPTLNGYSGNVPPGWRLFDIAIRRPDDMARLHDTLLEWCRERDLDRARVAWLTSAPDPAQ